MSTQDQQKGTVMAGFDQELYDQRIDAMMAETRRARHSSPWRENKRQRVLDRCQDARNADRLAAYKRKRADLGHWFP